MPTKDYIPDGAVSDFCRKIENELKSKRFRDYDPGSEIPFLRDVRLTFDRLCGNGSGGFIFSKCKELHQSPYVSYNGIGKYNGKTKVELADLMFVFTYYLGGRIQSRQVHISQSKCVKDVKKSHLAWEIDGAQHELLSDRPEFELTKTGASTKHDLSDANNSLLTYSFVSDTHRPFLHSGNDLNEMLDEGNNKHEFYYGKNPPVGARYLYPVTRQSLVQRYGSQFEKGDNKVCNLIEDIYEFGKLTKSRSPNRLQGKTDGGNRQSGFTIVNIEVDGDRELVGDTDGFNEGGELADYAESRFAERAEERLNFYAL